MGMRWPLGTYVGGAPRRPLPGPVKEARPGDWEPHCHPHGATGLIQGSETRHRDPRSAQPHRSGVRKGFFESENAVRTVQGALMTIQERAAGGAL